MLVKEEWILYKDLARLDVDSEWVGNDGCTEVEISLHSNHSVAFKESKPIPGQAFESSYDIPGQCLLNIS